MRENVFNKKVFIKSVKDHLKANYRKTVEEASQQELYQAVSASVKDVVMDEWLATQKAVDTKRSKQ